MDSQPAMLETATGTKRTDSHSSDSSESIVNISQSGASSISTTNTSSHATNYHLISQINQLQEDKKLLEGRIRGYKTLSDLLVESKKENQKLKAQISSMQSKHEGINSDQFLASGNSGLIMSLNENEGTEGMETSMKKVSLNEINSKDLYTLKASIPSSEVKSVTLSQTSGSLGLNLTVGTRSLQQESVPHPDDPEQTRLVSLPNSATAGLYKSVQSSGNLVPESLGHPSIKMPTIPRPSSSGNKNESSMLAQETAINYERPHNLLQLDSDKYDDATYSKVGMLLSQTHPNSPAYKSEECVGDSRSSDFPSLSSSIDSTHIKGHGNILVPLSMSMTQSFISQASDADPAGLAAQVENITEQLSSETSDSMPAIAVQMHQLAEKITKTEHKEREQRKLIETLLRENQDLKIQNKLANRNYMSEITTLRQENSYLFQELQRSRQNPVETSLISNLKTPGTHHFGDWVHVERPLNKGEHATNFEQQLTDRVRKLELERAELQQANGKWKTQWEQMEHSYQLQIQELHSKLAGAEQEITSLESRHAEHIKDLDLRMMETKRQFEEEESAREEAQHQLHLLERKYQEVSDQLRETQAQLSDTAHDKKAFEAELQTLKTLTENKASNADRTSSKASLLSLEMENAALKAQVRVFAEDFEHERQDRTQALATRDMMRRDVEKLTRQNLQLTSEIKNLQRQIKERDDTIITTLQQNEVLQREIADQRKKLALEWDAKQSLQQSLAAVQQQLLQRQQQQSARNPYLSDVFSAQSTYQPPLTPNSALNRPYFPSQDRTQPLNHPRTSVLSPEHLPGAWTCASCTYVNYPGRTVCEMCGLVNSPTTRPEQFGYLPYDAVYGSQEHALLMSRGVKPQQAGNVVSASDLVTDSM